MAGKVYVDVPCSHKVCRLHSREDDLHTPDLDFDCEECEGTGRVIVESDT